MSIFHKSWDSRIANFNVDTQKITGVENKDPKIFLINYPGTKQYIKISTVSC